MAALLPVACALACIAVGYLAVNAGWTQFFRRRGIFLLRGLAAQASTERRNDQREASMQPWKNRVAITVLQRLFRMRASANRLRRSRVLRQTGVLAFGSMDHAAVRRHSYFATVSVNATPSRAPAGAESTHAEEAGVVTRWLVHECGLGKPDVLLSITGGAQKCMLGPAQQASFERGLASAARAGNTWIITGGMDAGVMRLVGKSLADHSASVKAIGIAPWGAILGREALARHSAIRRPGGKRVPFEYACTHHQNSKEGAALESHHSHFVFVDDGSTEKDAWGSEISTRFAIERCVSKRFDVPLVLICVEGGPGTVKTVLEFVAGGCPVLLLRGTGGAADVCYEYVEAMLSRSTIREPDPGAFLRDQFGSATAKRFARCHVELQALVASEEARLAEGGHRLLCSFSAGNDADTPAGNSFRPSVSPLSDESTRHRAALEDNFETALLSSVLRGQMRRKAMLQLAVAWNATRLAATLLRDRDGRLLVEPRDAAHDPDNETMISETDVCEALLHAATVVADQALDEGLISLLISTLVETRSAAASLAAVGQSEWPVPQTRNSRHATQHRQILRP